MDDSYYDINYYNTGGVDTRKDKSGVQDQNDAHFENPKTPRSSGSLEEVIRKRTPIWISRVLKTHIRDDVELEELLANCWLLGRVAETLLGIVAQAGCDEKSQSQSPLRSPLRSPLSSNKTSFSLGERPYKAMMHDFDMFKDLCDLLEIREESRCTLSDVEQKRDGEKIGMCLWDICNALHDKSMTGELPEYIGRIVPKFTDLQTQSPSPQMKVGKKAFLTPPSRKIRDGFSSDASVSDQDDFDGSTRVLTSILTSSARKPRHAKLMDAVMMTNFCDVEEEESTVAKSPLPKIVDSFGSSVREGMEKQKPKTCVPEEKQVDCRKAPHQREEGGRPGVPVLVLIGVSMAAGFLLSSFVSSIQRKESSRRRNRKSHYDMQGRW